MIPRQAWSAPELRTERPGGDPGALELWCYTDRFSFRPGEEVAVHAHTTAPEFSLRVIRDGAEPRTVLEVRGIAGKAGETPDDAYARGCDWPVAVRFKVGPDWSPGLYLLVVSAADGAGRTVEHEHFIVVRSAVGSRQGGIALLLTTSTLLAYNDWGGANHYRGVVEEPWVDHPSPLVSGRRPIARGFLRLPDDAPRQAHRGIPGPMAEPTYPSLEFAREHGLSRHYGDAFWATYELPFVRWAERHRYELDYLTQHDLHFDPAALDGCDTLVIVGHDEYWSWEMRDAVDAFVDSGGLLARFAGNFTWQIRLDRDGDTQTCFKVAALDPFAGDPRRAHLTTTRWEAVGRPGAQTMGLTGLAGIYNRYGNAAPRSAGGYTVYRHEHWALEGTGLCYGDLLGGPPAYAAAFELDGVDYTFADGLPFATGSDGAPSNLEIVAIAPASLGEIDFWDGAVPMNDAEREIGEELDLLSGEPVRRRRFGSGMVATFERGAGTVFNAGSTEWVSGLLQRDPFIERITHNVLRRHGARQASTPKEEAG